MYAKSLNSKPGRATVKNLEIRNLAICVVALQVKCFFGYLALVVLLNIVVSHTFTFSF